MDCLLSIQPNDKFILSTDIKLSQIILLHAVRHENAFQRQCRNRTQCTR